MLLSHKHLARNSQTGVKVSLEETKEMYSHLKVEAA